MAVMPALCPAGNPASSASGVAAPADGVPVSSTSPAARISTGTASTKGAIRVKCATVAVIVRVAGWIIVGRDSHAPVALLYHRTTKRSPAPA